MAWQQHIMLVVVATLLLLGIAARCVDLGEKVYWVDEVHTSLRISGYTRADVAEQVFDGRLRTAESLRRYLSPGADQTLGDTVRSLAQHPEHPPLYYLLARLWVQLGGLWSDASVTLLRSVSLVFGLALLPSLYGFAIELFGVRSIAAWGVGLVAVSPLHILYAQEARQYSLWTLLIVLSSWTLLRAVRQRQLNAWVLYGITLGLGLYTHYLFTLVALGHGLYVGAIAHRMPRLFGAYSRATALAVLAFMPWVANSLIHRAQLENTIEATQREVSMGYLINVWFRNLNRVFFSADLATFNLLLVLLALYAVYYLCQHTQLRVWLLVVMLIAPTAVVLVVADSVTGGIASTRIRYLIPCYVGLQLAIAYLLAMGIHSARRSLSWVWRGALAVVLAGSVAASVVTLQHDVTWIKSDKAAYYPQMVDAINAGDRPLVISDSSPTYVLALSHQLLPTVQLELVSRPQQVVIPDDVGAIFLFDPSPRLQRTLTDINAYTLTPIVKQNETFQLLEVVR